MMVLVELLVVEVLLVDVVVVQGVDVLVTVMGVEMVMVVRWWEWRWRCKQRLGGGGRE